jgi:hypothetical protein
VEAFIALPLKSTIRTPVPAPAAPRARMLKAPANTPWGARRVS